MKTIINFLLLIILISSSSCIMGSSKSENTTNAFLKADSINYYKAKEDDNLYIDTKQNKALATQNFKGHEIYDQKTGMLFGRVPFPQSWKKTQDKLFAYKGPNNIKVSGIFGKQFFYGSPYGGQNIPPMSLQQIINEFFMPTARQTNRTLTSTYELPKVAQKEKNYLTSLWTYAPMQKQVNTYALEWKDPNNIYYITVLSINDNKSQAGSYWTFSGQYLEAPKEHFNEAKKQFIYGLENSWYNPEYILAYNQSEMQKAGFRNAMYQKRVSAIKQRTNTTKSVGEIYSEISDINHAGYLKRNNMNSHGHSKSISGINETVTIANHNTGEHYSVPMGNNHYWVANDGTYFGTNNSLYNPNSDQRVYEKEWSKFEIEQ
ncbi:hypothetical protein [Patiriisocius hiemis]|uniref:Lipoprotein n=1 Tax=Patiriisocius hiemis TaxID=3075604 RepID=A0ABU2YEM1_9FLAO|nr:hypothetical protein [Constantimarinum sp. W242]MDT0556316.1 hypothetical protein [Constantimarinum sp. W242]